MYIKVIVKNSIKKIVIFEQLESIHKIEGKILVGRVLFLGNFPIVHLAVE